MTILGIPTKVRVSDCTHFTDQGSKAVAVLMVNNMMKSWDLKSVIPTSKPSAPKSNAPGTSTKPASTAVNLSIKLRLQGIGEGVRQRTLPMKVSLDSKTSQTVLFTYSVDNIWIGTAFFQGVDLSKKYSLYIKGPKHLQKRICDAAPTETKPSAYSCNTSGIQLSAGTNTLDFSRILLLAGDLPPQDGVIDSADVSFIRQKLTSRKQDELEIGDVNLNGIIDTQDYALVIAALSIKTDDAIK